MHKTLSKFDLINSLINGDTLPKNEYNIKNILSIEREDGSGHCFNVRAINENGSATVTVFVRTID